MIIEIIVQYLNCLTRLEFERTIKHLIHNIKESYLMFFIKDII